MKISITLPWPPTANTYWRRNGNRYFISPKGQDYREHVVKECYIYAGIFDNNSRLRMSVDAYPPDKRRRDLDNIFKSLFDSLQAATVYPDDCQIDELYVRRMIDRENKVVILLEQIN